MLIVLGISMLFTSCSKSSNSNSSGNNPHRGTWSGTWRQNGTTLNGTWTATVDGNGNIDGEDNYGYDIVGTVNAGGNWNASGGTNNGDIFTGTISGNSVSGTYRNIADGITGVFSGTKQ